MLNWSRAALRAKKSITTDAETRKARRLMTIMNFELAHKQLAGHARGPQRPLRPTPGRPVHRPSVALILLASAVQIIGMAALLGTVANTVQ